MKNGVKRGVKHKNRTCECFVNTENTGIRIILHTVPRGQSAVSAGTDRAFHAACSHAQKNRREKNKESVDDSIRKMQGKHDKCCINCGTIEQWCDSVPDKSKTAFACYSI